MLVAFFGSISGAFFGSDACTSPVILILAAALVADALRSASISSLFFSKNVSVGRGSRGAECSAIDSLISGTIASSLLFVGSVVDMPESLSRSMATRSVVAEQARAWRVGRAEEASEWL